MSFLESIQHGLEKASQEATRIAKIQHLHNVANDLTFKAAQQGQNIVSKAMEMYKQGILAQGELTAICKQIADYQQQLNEVQEELQRLQAATDEAGQPAAPAAPAQAGYPAYPQAAPAQAYAPGTVPPGYPAYPTPQPGYAYPTPQPGYAYPVQAGYPAYPGVPAQPGYPAVVPSTEPPTQPLTPPNAPQAAPHKAPVHHHVAAPAPEAATTAPTAATGEQAPLAGTYAGGVLPPVFSPFTANPAATATEAEKPAAHHNTKKAAPEAAASADAPATEK